MSAHKDRARGSWWRRKKVLLSLRDEWGEVQLTRGPLGRELRFDGGALQGRLNLAEPWVPLSEYAVSMALAPALLEPPPDTEDPRRDPDQVCLLGVGSGNLAWSYQRALPHAELTLVELREAVVKVARRGLRLSDLTRSKVITSPAEVALRGFSEASLNLIAVDLFLSDGMAPPLKSQAFWGELFHSLHPRGVACVNLWSSDPEAYELLSERIRSRCGASRAIYSLSHLSFSNVVLFICPPLRALDDVIARATELDELLKSTAHKTRSLQRSRASAGLSEEPLADRASRLTLLS